MQHLKSPESPFSSPGGIDAEELTFARLDLKTQPTSISYLKIQTPKGLIITIPSGMDKDTVETVLNSLWRLPC